MYFSALATRSHAHFAHHPFWSIAWLRSEREAGLELVRDVASRERLMDVVAEHAHVLRLIRKSLFCETSLLIPEVAEFQ
jgi:hypothetical protein